MRIKKNDKVKVIAGKDKGQEGVVDRVYAAQNRILVTGVNIYKKHIKKTEQTPQGGLVELPRPLDASKVMVICPKCGEPTRLGQTVEKGKRMRRCKKCNAAL